MINEKERAVIGTFSKNLDEFENEIMTLIWDDGSWATAEFITCFEDANDFDLDDDDGFEEFISFMFKRITSSQSLPVDVENGIFLINYHDFPVEILVGDKKIN